MAQEMLLMCLAEWGQFTWLWRSLSLSWIPSLLWLLFIYHHIWFLYSPDIITICCAIIPLHLQSQCTVSLSPWITYSLFHYFSLVQFHLYLHRAILVSWSSYCSLKGNSNYTFAPFSAPQNSFLPLIILLEGCQFHFCSKQLFLPPIPVALLLLFMAPFLQLSFLEGFSKCRHPLLKIHSFWW